MDLKSLVFFDLDGTLLNDKAQINDNLYDVIHQLKRNGHEPILSSGRSIELAKVGLTKTGISSYVLLNGQLIKFRDKEVCGDKIYTETIERLITFCKNNQLELAYYCKDDFRTTSDNTLVNKAYLYFGIIPPKVDKSYYKRHNILMMLIFSNRIELDEKLVEQFPDLSFYRTSPYSLDIIPKNASKAEGIRRLIKENSLEHLTTYAFGDEINDLEMMEMVDYSIAMGNAIDIIKEKANYIVDDNNNDGIIQGLSKLNLIE